MLMKPLPKGRHWYGGKLVGQEGVEIPDAEVESFRKHGWTEVEDQKPAKKKAKAEKGED